MKEVKICYGPDETGPAELLSGRVARIVDDPVLNDLGREDIVLLTHLPGRAERYPAIEKILHRRYPCHTWVTFREEADLLDLIPHLQMARAEVGALLPPKEGKRGLVRVSHAEGFDPLGLASAIGIEQVDEDEDDLVGVPGNDDVSAAGM